MSADTDRVALAQQRARGRRQWVIAGTVLLAATGAGLYFGVSPPLTRVGLEVDARHLDFGEAFAQQAFQWVLPVRNRGKEPLTVDYLSFSCHTCTSYEPQSFTLLPGASQDVKLTLDLRPQSAEQAVQEEYGFEVIVVPVVAGKALPETRWELYGTVRNPCHVEPPTLALFGAAAIVHGQPAPAPTVTLKSHVPLVAVRAKLDPVIGSVSSVQQDDEGTEFLITFTPRPDREIGQFDSALVLWPEPVDEEMWLPSLEVPLRGCVEADVHAIPEQVALIEIGGASPAVERLALRSRSGREFSVQQVISRAGVARAEQVPGEAPPAYAVSVARQVAGQHADELTFILRTADGQWQSLAVRVRVYVAARAGGAAGGDAPGSGKTGHMATTERDP